MRPMPSAELRIAMARIGITQKDLSSVLHIPYRTLTNYLNDTSRIPAPVAILVRIMAQRRKWGDLLKIGYGGEHA